MSEEIRQERLSQDPGTEVRGMLDEAFARQRAEQELERIAQELLDVYRYAACNKVEHESDNVCPCWRTMVRAARSAWRYGPLEP